MRAIATPHGALYIATQLLYIRTTRSIIVDDMAGTLRVLFFVSAALAVSSLAQTEDYQDPEKIHRCIHDQASSCFIVAIIKKL